MQVISHRANSADKRQEKHRDLTTDSKCEKRGLKYTWNSVIEENMWKQVIKEKGSVVGRLTG